MGPSRIAVIAAVMSAPFLAACGGGAWVESSSAALDDPEPIGTFQNSSAPIGTPSLVVLMSDGTAHLEKPQACRRMGPLCQSFQFDGFYKRLGTGSTGRLDFLTADGTPVESYDYRYDGQSLDLLQEGTTQHQLLPKAATAWCSTAQQCDVQQLPTPLCVGAWSCASSSCLYRCRGP